MLDGHVLVDAHVHVPHLGVSRRPGSTGPGSSAGRGSSRRSGRPDGTPGPGGARPRCSPRRASTSPCCSASTAPRPPATSSSTTCCRWSSRTRGGSGRWPTSTRTCTSRSPGSWSRQLDLGAAALKIHPVHGGFRADDAALYPAYSVLVERGVPLVVHCGTSSFPGSTNAYADPHAARRRAARLPRPAGRARRTAAAAGGTTRRRSWPCPGPTSGSSCPGLPPKRLPEYYARFDLGRLARKWIYGTDWPGVPGQAANARAVASLGLPDDVVPLVLGGNALQVYAGLSPG